MKVYSRHIEEQKMVPLKKLFKISSAITTILGLSAYLARDNSYICPTLAAATLVGTSLTALVAKKMIEVSFGSALGG